MTLFLIQHFSATAVLTDNAYDDCFGCRVNYRTFNKNKTKREMCSKDGKEQPLNENLENGKVDEAKEV